MIAAAGSGSGKTTVTTALLKAFLLEGKNVAAYKCGPDYIDPMFHSEVIKIPSRNIDTFILGENNVKYVVGKNSLSMDISVVEGVMGYYDGTGIGTNGSSYEIARLLGCPVVLVLNCEGMAISVCAVIEGFKNFREESNIKGVILNNISEGMYRYYKNIIETNIQVKVYGYMNRLDDCKLESRHLGLVTAQEIGNLQSIVNTLGENASRTIDIKGLNELAQTAPVIEYEDPVIERKDEVNIGIAYDKSFCFYYRDSLEVLEKMGANLIYFSPMSDKKLPDNLSGLIFGGGYPELYMDDLSNNKLMLEDIKEKISSGIPTFAECGGYMYLLDSFKEDGNEYELAGVCEGQSYMTNRLNNFGYVTLTADKDNLMCKKGDKINGHEFHYSTSTNLGDAFTATKPESEKTWKCIVADDTKFMGYPHLHFLGNIDFARNFIDTAISYQKGHIK
ncbi:cobyrinate a,c-diamide synthase [Sedimentibacter saalensis]|uniref:cobyrinate a,c-diamide synthase n=1 Tax=Sedimentibacter saalensis TaxID=130788 RepID=UPI0028978FFA|nr:cobyrinate a,c-diamide synthase [Sedimentibacter saalensis]